MEYYFESNPPSTTTSQNTDRIQGNQQFLPNSQIPIQIQSPIQRQNFQFQQPLTNNYAETEMSFGSNTYRTESEITIPNDYHSNNNYQPFPNQIPPRRRGTVKNVVLKGGKLVLDIPVPDKVLSLGHYKDGPEFKHLR